MATNRNNPHSPSYGLKTAARETWQAKQAKARNRELLAWHKLATIASAPIRPEGK